MLFSKQLNHNCYINLLTSIAQLTGLFWISLGKPLKAGNLESCIIRRACCAVRPGTLGAFSTIKPSWLLKNMLNSAS